MPIEPDDLANYRRKSSSPSVAEVASRPEQPQPSAAQSVRIVGEFLKGPIPLDWLTPASKLRGKAAICVGIAVWFESGRRKKAKIKLTTKVSDRFCVGKNAKSRGLKALEKAGLVSVDRRERRNPVVTILAKESRDDKRIAPGRQLQSGNEPTHNTFERKLSELHRG